MQNKLMYEVSSKSGWYDRIRIYKFNPQCTQHFIRNSLLNLSKFIKMTFNLEHPATSDEYPNSAMPYQIYFKNE